MKTILTEPANNESIQFSNLPKNPIIGFQTHNNHPKGYLHKIYSKQPLYAAYSFDNGVAQAGGWMTKKLMSRF